MNALKKMLIIAHMAISINVFCGIIEIPADYPTIQQGIDASQPGDTILVWPGTYAEEGGVNILNKNLVLGSLYLITEDTSYITSTIISGYLAWFNRVLTISSTLMVKLTGFTIRDGLHGGISCEGNIEITHNRIMNNSVDFMSTSIHGIGIYSAGTCLISDNEITGNNFTLLNSQGNYNGSGAGIYACGNIEILRNNIHNNGFMLEVEEGTFKGGGIYCEGNCRIEENVIAGNYLGGYNGSWGFSFDTRGAGIYLQDSGTIINNVITGNYAISDLIVLSMYPSTESYGGGIFCNSGALIKDNTIISNSCNASSGTDDGFASAGAAGGGVFGGTLINNLIINNSCSANAFAWEWYSCGSSGGGVCTSHQVINNSIVNNSAGGCNPHGGGVQGGVLRNSIVTGNTPDNVNSASASYCNIAGGYPGTGNIDADPLFVSNPVGNYFLSQISAGQSQQSPCVDTGDPMLTGFLGTTRTDSIPDIGITDMGFHYLLPQTATVKKLEIKVILEGAFDGLEMRTTLNDLDFLPTHQPYQSPPWNYNGTEEVPAIPDDAVVDWMLIELRNAPSAAKADPGTSIHRQACFIMQSGKITGLDGDSTQPLMLNGPIYINNDFGLFILIWHRNHLAMMSSEPLVQVNDIYSWDFTDELSKAYLNGQKELLPGIFGMFGGDCDGSGSINNADIEINWSSNAGVQGYYCSDLNLDAQVNNADKNEIWLKNIGILTGVP